MRLFCNTETGGERFLEAYPKDDWARPVAFNADNEDQIWILKPIRYNLRILVFRAVYHTKDNQLRNKHHKLSFSEDTVIDNQGKKTVAKTVSTYSKTITNTVSLTFKEGFKVGTEIEFGAELPVVATGKVKLTAEAFVEFNQEFTNTTTETVSIVREVVVKAGEKVLVTNGIMIMDGVDVDATVGLKISAKDTVTNKSINIKGIKQILKDNQVKVRYNDNKSGNGVVQAEKDCVFKGTYKVKSHFITKVIK